MIGQKRLPKLITHKCLTALSHGQGKNALQHSQKSKIKIFKYQRTILNPSLGIFFRNTVKEGTAQKDDHYVLLLK